jgi:transcriptional regulator with PAS, ATPase and Fis domain
MKSSRRPASSGPDALSLVAVALEEVAGPALVLDRQLRIVAATGEAGRLLGVSIPTGITAPKLLCGRASERPVAEALAAGRPVVAAIPWPGSGGGERLVGVRATPIQRGGERIGWLLLLREDRGGAARIEQPVLFHGMWTGDPAMQRLFQLIEKVAASDASVLVRGETGSGKELVATAIHALSPRRSGPFRAINCAALPPNLLESELFGHVRGAFTGAVRDSLGHFRLADEGTLFLDEVAELPLELQAKLLRVVETHTVIPVGGRDAVAVDVRIVAATHRSLRREVEAGRFRADLMYRLRVVPLFIPPLRARPGDVLLLAQKVIETLNARGGRQVERLGPSVRAAFQDYSWPGNVRELRNVLEYAYVVGEGPVIVDADLPPELLDLAAEEATAPAVNRPLPLPADRVASPEADRMRRALERAGGNRDRAAQILGMSRSTLWRRMKALGLRAAD